MQYGRGWKLRKVFNGKFSRLCDEAVGECGFGHKVGYKGIETSSLLLAYNEQTVSHLAFLPTYLPPPLSFSLSPTLPPTAAAP